MQDSRNVYLIAAAVLDAIAALLHLACIVFGAPWYRFFGAGERMAQMAAAGERYPTLASSAIAAVLFAWSAYALSGAGVLPQLPLTRWMLCLIAGILVLRGIAGIPLAFMASGRSPAFWMWSSAICLVFGAVHLIGLHQVWDRL